MAKGGKSERESGWRAHVAAWKAGCGSQAEYCRQHGLTQNDFSWWKRELARRDANVETAAPTFIPVKLAAQRTPDHAFELTLRGGRLLRFGLDVDAAILSAVVRELERDAC